MSHLFLVNRLIKFTKPVYMIQTDLALNLTHWLQKFGWTSPLRRIIFVLNSFSQVRKLNEAKCNLKTICSFWMILRFCVGRSLFLYRESNYCTYVQSYCSNDSNFPKVTVNWHKIHISFSSQALKLINTSEWVAVLPFGKCTEFHFTATLMVWYRSKSLI